MKYAGIPSSRPESGAWNFRPTELEDGVEREGRKVLAERCGVGKTAGWACSWQTGAAVPANRMLIAGTT